MSLRFKFRPPTFRGLVAALLVLVFLAFTPIGRWVLVLGPEKGEAALDRRLDDIRFENLTLEQAFKEIGDRAGVMIRAGPEFLRGDFGLSDQVTLRLHNVTVRQAIDAILEGCGPPNEAISIDPAGAEIDIRLASSADRSLRLYDLNPLIDADLAEEARWLAPAPGNTSWRPTTTCCADASGPRTFPRSRKSLAEEFDERISSYATSSEPNGSITNHSNFFAIQGTSADHRRIRQFLDRLRLDPNAGTGAHARTTEPLVLIDPAINSRIPELILDNVSLQQAINRLQDLAPVNVIVPVWCQSNRTFSLHVRNVTAEQALDMILTLGAAAKSTPALQYRGDGMVVIANKSLASGPLAVYDIRDLIDAIVHEPLPASIDSRPRILSTPWDEAMSALTTLIAEQIDIEPSGVSGTSLTRLGGRLLVEGTPEIQRRTARFLNILCREFLESPTNGLPLTQPDLEARMKQIETATKDQSTDYSSPVVEVIPHLNLTGVTIMEAFQQIGVLTNARFSYMAEALAAAEIDLNARIDMEAFDVPVDDAVRMVFDAVSQPGTVEVGPPEVKRIYAIRTSPLATLRIYDVRDLIRSPLRDSAGFDPEEAREDESIAAGEIEFKIREPANNDVSWSENRRRANCTYFAGRFFVNQTLENHKIIRELLDQLRKSKSQKRSTTDPQ